MLDANPIVFAGLLLIMIAIEWLYVALAKRLKIFAPQHDHSLHRGNYVTTGGVIFVLAAIAALLPAFAGHAPVHARLLVVCSLALATISFYDDIWQVSVGGRLIVQILAVAVTFAFINTPARHLTYIVIVLLCVGYINSSNFMDGTDGMLGLNALITLIAIRLLFIFPDITGGEVSFAWLPTLDALLMCAAAAFLVFNLFGRPKVFAGDVGAVTIGFYIAFMLTMIYFKIGDWSIGVFAAVFVVETFMTVVYRLISHRNIFHAHREHVYQLLIRRTHISGVWISVAYAVLQAAIDAGWMLLPAAVRGWYAIGVAAVLVLAYVLTRRLIFSR